MLILGDVAPNVRKFLLEGILTQNLWRILHNSQNEILKCYKKHLQSSSWSEGCLQSHLCAAKIGELRLYLSSMAIILRATKPT
jgi:hypothetical protein